MNERAPTKRRPRVVLVYPPGEQKISEPIPPPNMTIAVLAGALRAEDYDVLQVDAEKEWFDRIRSLFGEKVCARIYDKDAVLAFVNGTAPSKTAAEYARISGRLLEELRIGPADLVAITLIDMRAEPLILNFSALLAHAAKRTYGARTAIGYRALPKEGYFYLLRKYPCFDYGAYARWGEKALVGIVKDAAGEKASLVGTVARRGRRLRNYPDGVARRPHAPHPLYEDRILERYKAYDGEILAKYNPDATFAGRLIKNDKRYLVAAYAFELTCPGACAFCDNDNRLASDRKSVDQVIDELSELKEKGVTGVYFVNSSFNNHYKQAEELCTKMIRHKLDLKWFDCANLRILDGHLLEKMAAAGAVKLTFGVETGSQRLLDFVKKGITVGRAVEYLGRAHALGIWNHIELIAGFPTEREEDIRDTLRFIDDVKDYVDLYTLNPFYLYPNSRFYREQERFGVRVLPYPPMQFMNFFYPRYRIVHQYSFRFDEIGGLRWKEKDAQISRSTKALADKIDSIASFRAIGNEHVYLLNCLYDKLGRGRKDLIRKMVRALTLRFKPYNLDFFMDDFRTSFRKQRDLRIFLPLKDTEFLGEAPVPKPARPPVGRRRNAAMQGIASGGRRPEHPGDAGSGRL